MFSALLTFKVCLLFQPRGDTWSNWPRSKCKFPGHVFGVLSDSQCLFLTLNLQFSPLSIARQVSLKLKWWPRMVEAKPFRMMGCGKAVPIPTELSSHRRAHTRGQAMGLITDNIRIMLSFIKVIINVKVHRRKLVFIQTYQEGNKNEFQWLWAVSFGLITIYCWNSFKKIWWHLNAYLNCINRLYRVAVSYLSKCSYGIWTMTSHFSDCASTSKVTRDHLTGFSY